MDFDAVGTRERIRFVCCRESWKRSQIIVFVGLVLTVTFRASLVALTLVSAINCRKDFQLERKMRQHWHFSIHLPLSHL